jgi:hypothetical protein
MKRLLGVIGLLGLGCLFALPSGSSTATESNFSETAKSADSLVDSVGVNVHIHYTDTPYADFPNLKRVLKELGVRHIREGMIDTKWQPFYDRLNELGREGIKADFVTSPKFDESFLAAYPGKVKDSIESYEAPNEYDQKGPGWDETLNDYIVKLNRAVKGNPQTANFPIIGPSLVKKESYPKVAESAAYFDYANLHNYVGGRNPGTKGWGPNGYGSIDWNLARANEAWPGKPVMTTETGYRTDESNAQGVPEEIVGKYFPRLLLEQYAHGIQRTYIYEMVDLGTRKKFSDFAFGLVREDYSPKPAFTAVKNLLGLLADPGPKFPLHALKFTLSGDATNVHHMLFEKRDGRMYLAMWLEEQAFDVNKKERADIGARQVSVRFNDSVKGNIHSLDEQGALQSRQMAPAKVQAVTLSDRVTIMEIQK